MVIPSLLPEGLQSQTLLNLAAAENQVRVYCGWHIAPVITEQRLLDGKGGHTLLLPTQKLIELDEVQINGNPLLPSDYDWSESGYVTLRHGYWPTRPRSVHVRMQHGYDSAPEVAEVIKAIAARADSSPSGYIREQAGSVSVSPSLVAPNVAGGVVLMQHEKDILAPYKLSKGL